MLICTIALTCVDHLQVSLPQILLLLFIQAYLLFDFLVTFLPFLYAKYENYASKGDF